MFLNLIHRVGPGKNPYLQLQQDYAHQLELKSTLMVQVNAMQDAETVAWVLRQAQEYGDEIGLSLTLGYDCPEYRAYMGKAAQPEDFIWLYNTSEKRFIISMAINAFRRAFGREPLAVASYHLDSVCMEILHDVCPAVKIAVAGCFEEGVKVFHGCNNSWYLFNEGMPWGPWYPSKTHSLRPAENEADWCGIVGAPHLSRDLALSYEGRNDFFASHPANAQRGLANVGYEHPYDYNLCDMYRLQEDFNAGFSYYNIFVSPGWLAGHPTIQDPNEVSQKLYYDLLAYCAELRLNGELTDMHMSEFADWYRQNWPIGKAEVYLAKEMLYGSAKHYFWYLDSAMRVLVDTNQGGSIGDLRPYAGKFPVATGSDQPALWYGSYPYLIQSQYRSGISHHFQEGARTTLFVTHNGETLDLGAFRTRAAKIERTETETRLVLSPARLQFTNGLSLSVETSYTFHIGGRIAIRRRFSDFSQPGAVLQAREQLKGCYGITEYPEDMRGVKLGVFSEGKDINEIDYAYQRRTLDTPSAAVGVNTGVAAFVGAYACIPQITTKVTWQSAAARSASAVEGMLFNPYYTLALDYEVKSEEETLTWLILSSAK